MSENPRCYNKPPLVHEHLLDRFKERGLIIKDNDKAIHYLKNISYFRLSGYALAFEELDVSNKRLHNFKDGISFNKILNAYIIDRKMRGMIMEAIERIEVSVRTIINHEMSCSSKNSHWYLDESLFRTSEYFKHIDLINFINQKKQKQEKFIKHYYEYYDDPHHPPCWMIAEVLPLGSWSKIYSNLRFSKNRKNISGQFDLAPNTLNSWLHALTYLRNLCAHHSRLYYRNLVITPKKYKDIPFNTRNLLYNFVAIIHWFLKYISPKSEWFERFEKLLSELPKEDHIHYGFEENWLENEFWF